MRSNLQKSWPVTIVCVLFLLLVPLSSDNDTWAQTGVDDPNAGSDDTQTIDLPRKIQKALDQQVFPALVDGDDVFFYNTFGTILQKATPARVAEIESYTTSKQLPSLLNHFAGIKMMRIEQGIDSADARMNLREAIYLIQGINGRLAKFVDVVKSHPFMHDPIQLPKDWKTSRDQFWNAHVIKNEFTNSFRLLEFGDVTLGPLARRIENSKEPLTKKVVAEFEAVALQINKLRPRLIESEAEARLIRFRKSLENLFASDDFESQFVAAMNVELDGEVLVPLLKQGLPSTRVSLNDPQLAIEIQSGLQRARTMEPEITEKAFLFRSGSHWWLRGRYGHAPLTGGMLKMPSAMNSGAEMNALYMPRDRPKPVVSNVDRQDENQLSYYVRRHYYTWAVEYRPLLSRYSFEKTKMRNYGRGAEGRPQVVNQQTRNMSNENFFY